MSEFEKLMGEMEGRQMPHLINGENWWPERYMQAAIIQAQTQAEVELLDGILQSVDLDGDPYEEMVKLIDNIEAQLAARR